MRSRANHSWSLRVLDANDDEEEKEKVHGRRRQIDGAVAFGRRVVGLVVVVLCTAVCLLWYYSNYSRSSDIDRSTLVRKVSFPQAKNDNEDCPPFGCPIYPPEFENVLDHVDESIESYSKRHLEQLPYATMNMATLTRISNRKPTVNQDAAIILEPFRTLQTTGENDFLLGIFDGHGMDGHVMARYVARELPEMLATKLNDFPIQKDDEWIMQTMKDTFVEVDANAPPNAMLGGCTASVTLRRGNKLFVANAGDSRTIVVTVPFNGGTENVTYASRRDKAHLPDERARILALNGTIHIPPHNPALSRVIVYSTAHVAHHENIGLAMSRSIGDWEWKVVGVTAEPLVDVLDLGTLSQAFVLAASDGLWDTRPRPNFFAKHFADCFYRKNTPPFLTCLDMIQRISPKNTSWYRDDITLIAKKLL